MQITSVRPMIPARPPVRAAAVPSPAVERPLAPRAGTKATGPVRDASMLVGSLVDAAAGYAVALVPAMGLGFAHLTVLPWVVVGVGVLGGLVLGHHLGGKVGAWFEGGHAK